MVKERPILRWTRPHRELKPRRGPDDFLTAQTDFKAPFSLPENLQATSLERQRILLQSVGIPFAIGLNAKDFAILLLQVAAEVEHALMVQYLYAANSIANTGDEYARRLRKIAIEEMGHLATVQNLLVLLGGSTALHVQRDVLRKTSEKNPLPLMLEPVSLASLAKYTVIERPENVDASLESKIAELEKIAEEAAHVEPHRVGAIYTVLSWMFMDKATALKWMDLRAVAPELPTDPHLTNEDLQSTQVTSRYQATRDEWRVSSGNSISVETAQTCGQAVAAIHKIAAEGEGFDAGTDETESHFEHFLALVEGFQSGKFTAQPTATSPTLNPDHSGESPTLVTDPYAALWARVHNSQYAILLVGVLLAFALPIDIPEKKAFRRALAAAVVESMKRALSGASIIMSTRPLTNGSPNAGATFDLDPSIVELPLRSTAGGSEEVDHAELIVRLREILQALPGIYDEIQQSSSFIQSDGDTLDELRSADEALLLLLSEHAPDEV